MGQDSRSFLIQLMPGSADTLQARLRRSLISAILDGYIAPNAPLPSCRTLSQSLRIARNTVVLAYQHLVEEGFLIARHRSGYYVNPDSVTRRPDSDSLSSSTTWVGPTSVVDDVRWQDRLKLHPTAQRHIVKPKNWQDQPYPFIYGQVDPSLFPFLAWRDCARQALRPAAIKDWVKDLFVADDPLLIEQIRTRLLPRRGIRVEADEILVTVGAQQALYLIANLLFDRQTVFGIEDPGYPDARNIAQMHAGRIRPLNMDYQGLAIDEALSDCDYVYTTPSHQFPTTVTMSQARREELLRAAGERDFILIEDDYESELAFRDAPHPALKSLDRLERVLYVASLTKILAPGLRMGCLVGPRAVIAEARALRRLMIRHPAINNQRTLALFIADGHYDSLLRRLSGIYHERLKAATEALSLHLSGGLVKFQASGSALWLEFPPAVDTLKIAQAGLAQGLVVEPGAVHFLSPEGPRNFMRLGISSIPTERIPEGIAILARLVRAQLRI